MSNGKGLGIFALLIGIVGLAVGGYSFFLIQTDITPDLDQLNQIQQESDSKIWYVTYESTYYPTNFETQVTDIYIDFNKSENEGIYFFFTSVVFLGDDSGLIVNLKIDGASVSSASEYYYSSSGSGSMQISISLQHFTANLSSGNHNASIWVRETGSSPTTWLESSKFSIRSFYI